MELNKREKQVWNDIENWEATYLIDGNKNCYYSLEERFNHAVKSLNPKKQEKLLSTIDSLIFHLHAIAQNSQYEKDTRAKILDHGRIFNSQIEDLSELKKLSIDQLRYIANKTLAKQRLLSLAQGSIVGTGSIPGLILDLPLMLIIHLRTIQMIAMTYGYDLIKPYEMMLVLKVFHVSTLPKTLQKEGWKHLMLQLNDLEDEWLFFNDEKSYKSTVWLQQPVKQIVKELFLFVYKRKLAQGIPLLGITIGGAANYFLAKQVSEIAHHFYQKRFLLEQKNSK